MKKITIIDGNSLLFRAYYATAYPGVDIMRSQDGTPTNAIFAFSNMINKILSNIKEGESIMVAFDAGKHNFRHDALETYKANRKPAPEDLVKQFPIVREFLDAINIFQFEEVGFEGDDIAGTVAKLAEQDQYEVCIYTSDRDFLQLVSDKINVNIIRKGLSDVMCMTPSLVEETYGFKPHQIIDYKGLRGDSSDNLPGIPGIGEKTAVKLIQEYGSFDNIIANVDNIKGKIGLMIKEHQEMGKISRDLAIIKTDIELPFNIEDTKYEGYDFQTINTFCQKYGLKQFINKVNPFWKKKDVTNVEIEIENITSLAKYPKPSKLGIALDFENEEDYTNSDIYGIGYNFDGHHLYQSFENLKNDEVAKQYLQDPSIEKYCYDYKAIKVNLNRYGIILNGLKFDLLLASYLLDSSLKNNVEIVMNIFGVDFNDNEDEISLFSKENPKKCVKTAYFSLNLYKKVYGELLKIAANDLYNNLELPLAETLAKMEIEGFPLDVELLDKYGTIYKEKENELSKEIYALAGEEFNIASPKQTADILFNKLGLNSNKKMSTSSDVLKSIADSHPIVNKILEYRKYAKLVSSYTEGLKNHLHPDGKIHAKFNQALTQTGRLSSSDPNLQNISIRDEEGKLIRKAFHYPSKDYEILSLDYSQIELRVLASLSKCQPLLEVFDRKEDIHAATAIKIFNLDRQPTDNERRQAKTVNFGIVYGISDWGLADQLSIPVKQAKNIINNFYNSYPEISRFFMDIINHALKDGYVSTLLGRRRYLRELHDSNYQTREFAKRAAMNAPIQGSAADLIKIAMIDIDRALEKEGLKTKMVLQIHDELIFKVPIEEKEKAYQLIKNKMEHALNLEVGLEVDGGFGEDWYSAK